MGEVNISHRYALERSIFATITYYDYFNYPLTAAEIWQYLIKVESQKSKVESLSQNAKPTFSEIIEILDNSEKLKKTLGCKNGFCFLAGRKEIVAARIRRKKLTDQKFKKSKWIVHLISYIPFTRLIMASGTMALGNPGKESDVDLLVAAKAGRIWMTRALLTFFALIFGKYRHKEETENRLCFNHYITDKSLAIDFGNLYKAQEYLNLMPIVGDSKLCNEFLAANREWMEKYIWFVSEGNHESLRAIQTRGESSVIKFFFEWILSGKIGDVFEKTVKKFQISFIEKNPLSSNPSARIKYTDDNLVFHPILVEPKIIAEYEEKIREFDMATT